jgi:hypothetical protein
MIAFLIAFGEFWYIPNVIKTRDNWQWTCSRGVNVFQLKHVAATPFLFRLRSPVAEMYQTNSAK